MKKNNSIKRAQSQAGLSFAERKNFRPMAKFFTMLALLCLTATGAWADWTGGTYTATANENLGSITVTSDATLTINSDVTVTVTGGINVASGTLTIVGPGELVVTGAAGSTGDEGTDDNGGPGGSGGAAISGAVAIYSGTITATGGAGGAGGYSTWCAGGNGGNGGYAFAGTLTYYGGTITATGGAGGAGGGYSFMSEGPAGSPGSPGQAFASNDAVTWENDPTSPDPKPTNLTQQSVTFSGPDYVLAPAGPEVTTNAPAAGQPFTEASFDMPTYDLTVDYELVRDMSVDMTVTVEDAQGKSSIRLKKMDSGKYEPADMTPQQMAGLITVTDDIEDEELTNNTDYTVSIFAVDDNDQPTGTAIAFADLTPGRYVAFATAKEGTIYDGRTLPSNVFKLFVGYEVEVGAESFATFYKDEKLTVEESSTTGELYTISSVSADEAVLSAQIGVAPANTPLLVYNSGSEKKTILLIPTDDQADNVTAYGGFKGTLVASTIAASTNDQTNYALNGKQFVWVKNALSIAANKCWLEVVNSNARAISIMFNDEETTGISTAVTTVPADGDWYDLNGRKVTAPTRKGVYIHNGKKAVVK